MKKVSAAKVAAQFNDYLDASQEQPVLVTRNGKPIAMLLGIHGKDDADRIATGGYRTLRSILEESSQRMEEQGAIPHDRFWRMIERSRRAKKPRSGKIKRT